ncbi:hypothetical protein KM043_000614 [Ampulex compressa]|nr:hypothetical protein KM043_000614 [Ampulex compressa]
MWKNLFPRDTKAHVKLRQRLAIAYAIIAWNTAGFLIYSIISERLPTEPYKRRLILGGLVNAETIQINRFEGLKHVESFSMNPSREQTENSAVTQEL